MNIFLSSVVVLLVSAAQSGTANQEVKAAVNIHNGKTMVVDGHQVNTADYFNRLGRVLRQTCSDQWSNCAADVVYQGTTYKALFPGGSGCSSVAGTSSSMVSYACQCTTTCPAFCGTSACGTTTVASGGGTTTTTTTTTTQSTQSTTTAAASSGLDTSQAGVQTSIVNLHNTLRRRLPSPGMLELSWDSGVASVAQAWANQCTFSHPGKSLTQYWVTPRFGSTGQNIGSGYASWNDVINAWYNEINHFQFGVGSTTSEDVGHYTQVVWNGTYTVGCGYKQCPSWQFFVCNYGPAGNISPYANYPYQAGPACTGTNTCDAGLRTNPCPYVNAYSNCEVDQPGYPALYPNGCGTPATGGLKDSCQATCLCKPQGLLYRL